MKKIIYLVIITLSLLAFVTTAYAYNLSDIKKDYPNLKIIKMQNGVDDYGQRCEVQQAGILKLHATGEEANDLIFTLVEYSGVPSHVLVTHYFKAYIDSSTWWNGITIRTVNNSVDVFPSYDQSIFGQLIYKIHDISEFNLWKDAILISVKGKKLNADFAYKPCYADFSINQEQYKTAMSIIQRFLFTK